MSTRKRKGSGQEETSKIPKPTAGSTPAAKRILRSDQNQSHSALIINTGLFRSRSASPEVVLIEQPSTSTRTLRKQASTPSLTTNNKLKDTKSKPLNQLQKLTAAAKVNSILNKELCRKAKSALFKGTSWVDRSYPQNVEELFVHKKKVEEVQSWLGNSLGVLRENFSRPYSKICVLTGPSGSGKTATLFSIAKEMNIEIKEWINPTSLTEFKADRLAKFDPEEVQGRSQFDLFSNFIFRASQYNTLPIKGRPKYQNKIVAVEDFPTTFYRSPETFHNSILRPYNNMGGCPIVFIVADSASRDTNANSLFPKHILQELEIKSISFNSVATSFMVKFMMSVCSKEGVFVDKSVVESIALASNGDIRCAINTLQFQLSIKENESSKSIFKVPASRKTVKNSKTNKSSNPTDPGQKDETLFLFRALGKVLYAKREPQELLETENPDFVPDSAKPFLRLQPLQEDVEELVNKIESQADNFLNFLQQNYVSFFGSMDDIVTAASLMADSEHILSRWPFDDSGTVIRSYKEREAREEVALLVASRGIMYSNVNKAPFTFRSFKKPMFGDVRTRVQKSVETVKQLFYSEGAVQENFYTEVLPQYAKLTSRHRNHWTTDQKRFINEIGVFKRGYPPRMNQETLLETDAVDASSDTEENNVVSPEFESIASKVKKMDLKSQVNDLGIVDANQLESEEEFIIEDYDD